MNIFTVNQVNQVYVLKNDSTVVSLDATHDVTKANNLGTIGVGKTADGKNLYFKHLGAGGLTRSDLIKISEIMDIKATPASAMSRKLSAASITVNSEAMSGSTPKPIAGQDFILRIKFQNPIGMSPDNQYFKFGAVHMVSSKSESDFYRDMAISIAKNMAREEIELIKVFVAISNGTETEVTANTSAASLTGTYTKIIIKEVNQPWILGVKQEKPVLFTIEPGTIDNGSEEVVWGDVIYSNGIKTTGGSIPATETVTSGLPSAGNPIVNSKLMADYEYFYMGERADQYRMVGFPDYVPTTYLVDPTNAYGYDTIGIHFAYVGANHAVQKSEKDITILVPRAFTDTTATEVGALATEIVEAIDAIVNPSTASTTTEEDEEP